MTGFDVATVPEHTIIGWVGGQGVIEMDKVNNASDTQVMKDALELIENFTGIKPPYPRRFYM